MDANKNEKQKDLKLMNWALKFASSAGLVDILCCLVQYFFDTSNLVFAEIA